MTEECPDEDDTDPTTQVPLAAAIATATDTSQYPLAYRRPEFPEMTAEWRRLKLEAIEMDRAAQIRAAQDAEAEGVDTASNTANIRAASSAAQAIEKMIESCHAVARVITKTIVAGTEEQSHTVTMGQVESIAKLVAVSTEAGAALGRLRDGYGRSLRHLVIEDNRARRYKR